MERRATNFLSWITSPLTRTSKSIDEKPQAPWSKYQECNSGRSSTDVESQASSDGSTLLDTTGEKENSSRIDPRVISDAIIGLSDGLTVPFALTAGLSALGNTRYVGTSALEEAKQS